MAQLMTEYLLPRERDAWMRETGATDPDAFRPAWIVGDTTELVFAADPKRYNIKLPRSKRDDLVQSRYAGICFSRPWIAMRSRVH